MQVFLPYPAPVPIPNPFPNPGIGLPVAPGISPGISPGVSPGVSPGFMPSTGANGSAVKPFGDLFNFPVDWRYILAIFLLLVTVTIVESWNERAAYVYVAILLLGVLVVNDRTRKTFPSALEALIRATKGN